MIPSKLETDADSSDCVSMAIESRFCQDQESRNRGGSEPKKRLKKLRSIKLSRLPSSKLSTRRVKHQSVQHPILLSGSAANSKKPSQIEVSDVSPNYMKATSCSNVRKDHFQASPRNSESSFHSHESYGSTPNSAPVGHKSNRSLTRQSSLKPVRTLSRMSSLKSKRPLIKKKLKKSRSIKPANFDNRRSSTLNMIDASTSYLKATTCSSVRKARFQASPDNSDSSSNSKDHRRKNSYSLKPNSGSSGITTARVLTRKSSLRPVRLFTKMASLRPMRPSMRKCSQGSQFPDLSVDRATCSSTFKNAKFDDNAEIQLGGSECKEISAMKVCPYSYCSLHGHHHAPSPPLKRFLSLRRRSLRTQKSMKLKTLSPVIAKHSGDIQNGTQTSQIVFHGDPAAREEANASEAVSPARDVSCMYPVTEIYGKDDETINDFRRHAEILLGETSYPQTGFKENQQQICDFLKAEHHTPVAFPQLKAKSLECCRIRSELDNPVSEATGSNLDNRDRNSILADDQDLSKLKDPSEENNECSELCDMLLQQLPQVRECEPQCSTDVAQLEKQKYIRMWRMIYQNVVSGVAAKVGAQSSIGGSDGELHANDANTLLERNISGSCRCFSEKDQHMGMGNHDAGGQRTLLHRIETIKLVEAAIDEILLPEIEDQSSDDQSIASDRNSEQDLLKKNHSDAEELSVSTSTDSAGDSLRQFEKMEMQDINKLDPVPTVPEADNTAQEEEKIGSKAESKSSHKMRNSWSNLKKLILLQRFFKAVEKVRKINPQVPRYLLLEPDPEAEKIHLRHQKLEQRKSAEEWLLDYALQQVVAKLTPARKRRVELLVEAFETVIPPSEIETQQQHNTPVFTHAKSEACVDSPLKTSKRIEKENDCDPADILPDKTPEPEINFEDYQDQITTADRSILLAPELKEIQMESCCIKKEVDPSVSPATDTDWKEEKIVGFNLDNGGDNSTVMDDQPALAELEVSRLHERLKQEPYDTLNTYHEEVPEDGGCSDAASESNGKNLETNPLTTSPFGQSPAITKSQNQANKENDRASVPGHEVLQQFIAPGDSEPDFTIQEAYRTQLDKQKYMKMWHTIYGHVVSGVAAKVGTQLRLNGVDQGKEADGDNSLLGENISGSCQGLSGPDQDIDMEDQKAGLGNIKLHHIDAIKLVEEAIDEILLPEVQDQSSDEKSITSDINSEHDLLEMNTDEGVEQCNSSSMDSVKDNSRISDKIEVGSGIISNAKETRLKAGNITTPEHEKRVTNEGSRSNQPRPNGWSNLKKMILLKRFIKALEKGQKFNLREPRYLHLEPDPEAEKINLRHQTMEERKSAEEWMLDRALQQVVAKLTPARKRRVELLVKAFETVIPPSEIGINLK